MKVRRFMYVVSPNNGLHIKYGNTAEGPAKCGTFVAKGWKIIRAKDLGVHIWPKKCKRCKPSLGPL